MRINPKWDSAEVALDFDWILSIVFLSILIPINSALSAIDLIKMSCSGSAEFCQVDIEWQVNEEWPLVLSDRLGESVK